jgi:hypothetical protein
MLIGGAGWNRAGQCAHTGSHPVAPAVRSLLSPTTIVIIIINILVNSRTDHN